MIHVITVHYQTDKFWDIQYDQIKKNVPNANIWASFDRIEDPDDKGIRWAGSVEEDHRISRHCDKLDHIADLVCEQSTSGDDILLFLDGDAWPINKIDLYVEKLEEHPLVSVIRRENNGDLQPHPLFSMTTVKYWKENDLTWDTGPSWGGNDGKTHSDPGAKIWKHFQGSEEDWYRIPRVNKWSLHPVFFGVYGLGIYHHGAGFRRSPITRYDLHNRTEDTSDRSRVIEENNQIFDWEQDLVDRFGWQSYPARFMRDRSDVINVLMTKEEYDTYCEIGVADGKNLARVNSRWKVGVDPNLSHEMLRNDQWNANVSLETSGSFFSEIDAKDSMDFDLFFIDGLHKKEQVKKDVYNAMNNLNEGGAIVLHDCDPLNEESAQYPRENREVHGRPLWNGNVWEAWLELRRELNCLTFTVAVDFGCGVIFPDEDGGEGVELPPPESFQEFKEERIEYLGMIDFPTFARTL